VPTTTLEQLPVALFRAFDEHSAGLMREYTLTLLGGSGQPFGLDDVARAANAKAKVSTEVDRVAETLPDSARAKSAAVTLNLDLSFPDAGAFGVLQGVLDHANHLAYSGELLVLPVLPELAAVRNWICDEIIGQMAGAAPRAWALPSGTLDQPGRPLALWEGLGTLPAHEAWLVGDDANRIIAASDPALELLGWDEEDLVGQRIVVVIPPALRELHVAAFTTGLLTGAYHLLDQPLELAAHTRDGRNIDVVLTLQKYAADHGRCVFLARLESR
jgi:PAS domain S-box-containing protein